MLFLVVYEPRTSVVDLAPILQRSTPHEVVPIVRRQVWLVRHPNATSSDELLSWIRAQTGLLADDCFFVTEVGGEPACSHTISNHVEIQKSYASSARRIR